MFLPNVGLRVRPSLDLVDSLDESLFQSTMLGFVKARDCRGMGCSSCGSEGGHAFLEACPGGLDLSPIRRRGASNGCVGVRICKGDLEGGTVPDAGLLMEEHARD